MVCKTNPTQVALSAQTYQLELEDSVRQNFHLTCSIDFEGSLQEH